MDSVKSILVMLCFSSTVLTFINGSNETERKDYIVYMGDAPKMATPTVDHHHSLLVSAIGDEQVALASRIRSYGRSFNGFAAKLLPHEAQRLKDMEGIVSVFPSIKRKLHTTRSWNFLGFLENVKRKKLESNIVVGLIDTGIYVDSPSFNDKGFGPPPAKWKGKCEKGGNFTHCNNKIVGARYYTDGEFSVGEELSPADFDGHGTHTSSTLAGISVVGASLYGLGRGTARGGVPSARLAMYKVCWWGGCKDTDLLAGFDDAIADGVDLISVSIGGPSYRYFNDPIAIGSFHAMKKGILSVCSAGNDGPEEMTVTNIAPWILTVSASAMDRKFITRIRLGNGKAVEGMSLNTFSPKKVMYPLTSGARAENATGEMGSASSCDYGTLDKKKVKGKLVFCLPGEGGQDDTLQEIGGAGTIIQATLLDVSYPLRIPGAYVDVKAGNLIDKYINSTKSKAKAVIEKSRETKVPAPRTASFSSRGPNPISPNILKPDVLAPGVDILAGWSRLSSVTGHLTDMRLTSYNILSGTSMSCPHVAGIATYIKSFHPAWSPAAIKSAIMTTVTPMDPINETEFDHGAGQIDPRRALHPGLVYDLTVTNYMQFLCKEGYNGTILALVTGGMTGPRLNCSSYPSARGTDGINYPSMQLQLSEQNAKISATFYRTVTNVGLAKSVYKAKITSQKELQISVTPDTLTFNKLHEKKSFKVHVRGTLGEFSFRSGVLEWSDSKHTVRSPIVVYVVIPL